MKKLISFVWLGLFIVMLPIRTEAETLAWKIPLDWVALDGLESDGVKKLAKPPVESVFFGEGDELWDVSGPYGEEVLDGKEHAIPDQARCSWTIWNATRKRLVTPVDIRHTLPLFSRIGDGYLLHMFLHELSIFPSEDGFSLPPDDAVPALRAYP